MAGLTGAGLSGAELPRKNLIRAELPRKNLIRADLRGCLDEVNLEGAAADERIVWPEGFDPEAAGVIFE